MEQVSRLLLLLLLPSCLSRYQSPTHYQLSLDPMLPVQACIDTENAFGAWRYVLPELSVEIDSDGILGAGAGILVTVGDPQACDTSKPCVMGTTIFRDDAHATVYLNLASIDAVGSSVFQTAMHELGHGMGLQHSRPGELMAPNVGDQAGAPTQADVDAWRALR